MTELITIHIDTHPSGRGFRITDRWPGHCRHLDYQFWDIGDALKTAFRIRRVLERGCHVRIPDKSIIISQESIERNALLTENNRQAYAGIMTGKVKVTK